MQRRTSSSPSVGPYCSAAALESTATRDISIAKSSAGNVVVSGRPVASEMTSGRAVTAIMSRIAEDVIPRVRLREQPAVALDLVRAAGGVPLPGVSSIVMRRERNASAHGLSPRPPTGPGHRRGDRHPAVPARPCSSARSPRGDLGLDFEGTDFSFLEETAFLLAIVVAVAVFGIIDRRRGGDTSGQRTGRSRCCSAVSLVLGALLGARLDRRPQRRPGGRA